MSWLPGMVFMHILDDDEHDLLQDPPDPVEQYSTRCDAEDAPVVAEVHPPVIDGTPPPTTATATTTTAPSAHPPSQHAHGTTLPCQPLHSHYRHALATLPLKRYSSVFAVATKRTRSAPTLIATTIRPQQ